MCSLKKPCIFIVSVSGGRKEGSRLEWSESVGCGTCSGEGRKGVERDSKAQVEKTPWRSGGGAGLGHEMRSTRCSVRSVAERRLARGHSARAGRAAAREHLSRHTHRADHTAARRPLGELCTSFSWMRMIATLLYTTCTVQHCYHCNS